MLNADTNNNKAKLVTGGNRRSRTFSFSTDSRPGSKVPPGDLTIKRSGRVVELVRPNWEGAIPTVARFFPMWNPDDPSQFDPTRLSSRAYDLSDFIRSYPAVKWVGYDKRLTFILYDPRDVREGIYDPSSHPYTILNNAINQAVLAGKAMVGGKDVMTGSWFAMVSDRSKKKAFSRPTRLYFAQGALFAHGKEVFVARGVAPKGLRPDDHTHVFQMTGTAGMGLVNALEKTKPGYTGDTDDLENYYINGRFVDLKHGSFVVFRNPDKHDSLMDVEPEDNTSKNETAFNRWEVDVMPSLRLTIKAREQEISPDLSQYENEIRSRIVWWDDIIHIPSHEEICVHLAMAYRSEPDILRFGWADHPEFFTDDVVGILAARSQATVPGLEDVDEDDDNIPMLSGSKQSAAMVDDFGEYDDVESDDAYNVSNLTQIQELQLDSADDKKIMGQVPKHRHDLE